MLATNKHDERNAWSQHNMTSIMHSSYCSQPIVDLSDLEEN
jgi:hypothetical protein